MADVSVIFFTCRFTGSRSFVYRLKSSSSSRALSNESPVNIVAIRVVDAAFVSCSTAFEGVSALSAFRATVEVFSRISSGGPRSGSIYNK